MLIGKNVKAGGNYLSKLLINEYRGELDRLRSVSGSRRESVLREAFKDLLKRWGRTLDLTFVPEHDMITPQKNRIYVDGALLHALRVPFGYWEAKDENDKLNDEIAAKRRKGYPIDNIIFEDTRIAVLIQNGSETTRASMEDTEALYDLLLLFFSHQRAEIADFNKAVIQFAIDLPKVLEALRSIIAMKRRDVKSFKAAEAAFLKHAQEAINPAVTIEDVQEMLIQHILTEDIFAKVFDNPEFHRQNNVASELYKLENVLFERGAKSQLLRALAPYYAGIASTAALIQSHSEKQGFLKALYENFYKVYNEKAADRLGVVYTPGEIVRFMVRSTDWLCEKHFQKSLIDSGVDILDPATGTGTFIVELLEHFRGNRNKLDHKYANELHANEIGILPYYVANLNIEATYQTITGSFSEFENLCLVDTLDNVTALGIYAGHQFDLLGSISDENIERIKRQNRRKISVIIGNPPYNANQMNENDDNKNRVYEHIDKRIKATYIKASTARKTKLYDMYSRFYRWASDRLPGEGVLCFITNRSFISSRTFDGFRKTIAKEFHEISIIDLGGDVRTNPELSGTKHNVFGIQTGVAICFLVQRRDKEGCTIYYARRPEDETAEDKLSWLGRTHLSDVSMTTIKPDADGNWLDNEEVEGWSGMLPVGNSSTKSATTPTKERAIFKIYSLGVVTARDEWVYDFDDEALDEKLSWFTDRYEKERKRLALIEEKKRPQSINEKTIKLTRALKKDLINGTPIAYNTRRNRSAQYRPFVRQRLHFWGRLNEMQYQLNNIFPTTEPNPTIAFRCVFSNTELATLAVDSVFDYGLLKTGNGGTDSLPRYRYTKSGERVDNITDWAVNKFTKHYGKRARLTKDTIFHYTYAVLHDPVYREKYGSLLKREFPKIPFYPGFAQWAAWGAELMRLHTDYDDVEAWPVERVDKKAKRPKDTQPKAILKSDPAEGTISIDSDTQLSGIPSSAWSYRLSNRSAIDWVLDQHKESRPRDPTIAASFNTYRLADHKEDLIETLSRVIRIALRTLEITAAMVALDRSDFP